MAAQGMRSYEMSEIGVRGLDACLTEASAIATDECDGVFLSVDIDVCDPGHAPGTGTPEPGGLSARQLLDAVRRLAYSMPIVGVDIVEVSPPYDSSDITAALANRVALEVLSATARKRRDAAGGTPWDPGAATPRRSRAARLSPRTLAIWLRSVRWPSPMGWTACGWTLPSHGSSAFRGRLRRAWSRRVTRAWTVRPPASRRA